jgi:hypothetical protein
MLRSGWMYGTSSLPSIPAFARDKLFETAAVAGNQRETLAFVELC